LSYILSFYKKAKQYLPHSLIALNLAIFAYANTIPILWTQGELFHHGFFWSMDGMHDFNLHLGLRFEEFLKPFVVYYVDGAFRTRHFSYLMEMLTFKFWQQFGLVLFRNYTIICIHIINAILLGALIYKITKKKMSAVMASLFFLNSGISIATLLFPFRNAKILAVTFFLVGWNVVAGSKERFHKSGLLRVAMFFIVFLLALFTDEISFFIFPLTYLYMLITDGKEGVFNKKILVGTFVTIASFLGIAYCFYRFSFIASDYFVYANTYSDFFTDMTLYFSNTCFILDIARSFIVFFLRRNFGYWDFSVCGVLAFMASVHIITIVLFQENEKKHKIIAYSILSVMLVKILLLPHNSGVHDSAFMPRGTVFPSLMFFSYYYVYAESLLLSIVFGLLVLGKKKTISSSPALILFLVTVISISSVMHLRNGPKDGISFHKMDNDSHRELVKKIQKGQRVVSDKNKWPIYLSFPSNEEKTIKARRHDDAGLYAKYVSIKYLNQIRDGNVVVSAENLRPKNRLKEGSPFLFVDNFYDLYQESLYRIDMLREKCGGESLTPMVATGEGAITKSILVDDENVDHIIFFVKGKASVEVRINNAKISSEQAYGYSYQMFCIFKKHNPYIGKNFSASITLKPEGAKREVSLVGPLAGYEGFYKEL